MQKMSEIITQVVMNEATGTYSSTITCTMCRQRKIKCSREVPCCMVCRRSAQQCHYPETAKRPGPRVGYVQGTRQKSSSGTKGNGGEKRKRSRSSTSNVEIRGIEDCEDREAAQSESSASPSSETIHSLSLIIHPWHTSYVAEVKGTSPPTASYSSTHEIDLVRSSCLLLGIEYDDLDVLISQFSKSYTSFQLFRETQIREKLQHMESETQINAFLSAILAFVFNAAESPESHAKMLGASNTATNNDLGGYFANRAIKYLEQAIDECDFEAVPLPLLQALTLITHWLLTKEVRGRAWRYLGLCIRSAYELNLHSIDSGHSVAGSVSDPVEWQEAEERRRLWWAIWEMDVFASVMRRCPTAIDWSDNETFLPSETENWFKCQPQKSCFLARRVSDRGKLLEASGNQSPKAWFIVINSLVKDAQNISSPVGVGRVSRVKMAKDGQTISSPYGVKRGSSVNMPQSTQAKATTPGVRREHSHLISEAASERLSTICNSLNGVLKALPPQLRYQDQFLSFGGRLTDTVAAATQRQLHSSIYSIHLMGQLVKLMIYKYYIFQTSSLEPSALHTPEPRSRTDVSPHKEHTEKAEQAEQQELARSLAKMAESPYLEQYFEAADEISTAVHRSSEHHYKYVNPFLSNTVWLAAVVQLVHRELAPNDSDKDLVHSHFELLSRKYDQFVRFWATSGTLQKDLDTFKAQLEHFQDSVQGGCDRTESTRHVHQHDNSNSSGRTHGIVALSHGASNPPGVNEQVPKIDTSLSNRFGTAQSARAYSSSGASANENFRAAHDIGQMKSAMLNISDMSCVNQIMQPQSAEFPPSKLAKVPMLQNFPNVPGTIAFAEARQMSPPISPAVEENQLSGNGTSFFDTFSFDPEFGGQNNLSYTDYLDELLSGPSMI